MISRRDFVYAGCATGSAVALAAQAQGRLLHGSVLQNYEGSVASRARPVRTKDTSNKYLMARSAHVATENLTSIKLAFSNFANLNGGSADAGLGASATVIASIEYPSGTFTQVKFSGTTTGTISDASLLFSDYLPVSVPSGATFWVRIFWNNPNGTFYNNYQNAFLGEAMALSTTSISNQTMGGTITNSGSYSHAPIAILGITRNPSVIIIGDSLGVGWPDGEDVEDTSNSATGYGGKVGVIARSLGNVPFINLCEGGEAASDGLSNSTARKLLWTKGSHVFTQYVVNDMRDSETSATTIAALQAIWANIASFQKIYQTTCTPLTTSTDSWATLGNQTVLSSEAQRQVFNAAVRAGISGIKGYVDITSALESSLNSGKWLVSPSPPYTPDGIHPNQAANLLVAAGGLFPVIAWP
jgi:hypothetical protein